MPLTALFRGNLILAPALDEESWSNVLRAPPGALRLRCCEDVAVAAESGGIRLFQHPPGARCSAVGSISERLPHAQLRAQLAVGVRAAGWDVEPDSGSAPDGYDVLARTGSLSVVFRIHATEPAPETASLEIAQRLYATVGQKRVIWLCRTRPVELEHHRHIRFFLLTPNGPTGHQVDVGGTLLDADDFACRGLTGGIRFAACTVASPQHQEVSLHARPMRCVACGTDNPVVYPGGEWSSACGRRMSPIQLQQLPLRLEHFQAAIARADGGARVEFRTGHGWVNACARCNKTLVLSAADDRPNPLHYVQDLGQVALGEAELSGLKLPTAPDPHWCCGQPACPPPATIGSRT
ncbi:MAG: hypothetical protein ACYDGR_09790 [Candidatus Dormibacteria bacterium]